MKKNFYDHKLAASNNDIKATWKILNEVLYKRKSKLTYPSCFKSNGELFSDTTSIATSSNHSTYKALINIIASAMDKRESTAGVFLDFRKLLTRGGWQQGLEPSLHDRPS